MSSKGFLSRLFKFNQVYKGGKEVGVDKFGNRYMFNPDLQPGRQRWIEYASDDVDATQIPAEWHSWVHYLADEPPSEETGKGIVFKMEHVENPSNSGELDKIYLPRGHYLRGKGMKKDVETWEG
eukprot:TRINITY_DN5893_c1_g1_i3.p1 TRINITY_DN5893_c1_g1~~TRINITY_DN5893_c1_g1_i3.p1  ORF type:complete len:124 (+),score=38.38 TRINITY_DN5893_c1_g1_i3:70-441(+)